MDTEGKVTRQFEVKAKEYIDNFDMLINVMRCAIWYQTLKNGVPTVGQNAVLTSQNTLERQSQKSVSLKGTVMQTEKVLINDRLGVSKISRKFRISTIYNFAAIYP